MSASDGARERMQVIARIRPMLKREVDTKEECAIAIRDNQLAVASSTQLSPVVYRLDKVLGVDKDQASVFGCIKHNLDAALEGFNTTVFAYGQTGTGKTHTMLGIDMWQLAQEEHARIAAAPRTPAAPRRDPRTPRTGASAFGPSAGIPSGAAIDRLMEQMDGGDMLADLMQYEGEFHPSWGLIPRAMAYLFRRLTVGGRQSRGNSPRPGHAGGIGTGAAHSGTRGALPAGVVLHCSYLEVYAERVFDLLRPETVENRAQVKGQGASTGLDVVHDKTKGVVVPEAVAVQVQSEEDVLSLLWEGAKNRLLSSTDMNQHSSRSHTIWQVTIRRTVQRRISPGKGKGRGKGRGGRGRAGSAASAASDSTAGMAAGSKGDHNEEEDDEEEEEGIESVVVQSKINLVDLAGSEKIRTHDLDAMSDRRLTELTSINASLSCLSNCIRALADSSRTHIPYRDSKLTRLLQDSLGGNCKTTFVVTLSPASNAIDETVSTLQFAERAKRVEMHASKNETLDDASLLKKYEHQVQRLKKLLREARMKGGTGGTAGGLGGSVREGLSASGGGGGADIGGNLMLTAGAGQLANRAREEIADLRAQLRGAQEDRRGQQQEVLRLREELHVEQEGRRQLVLTAVQRAGDAVQTVSEAAGLPSIAGSTSISMSPGGGGSETGSRTASVAALRAAAAKAAEGLRAVESDRAALRKRAESLAADEEDTKNKQQALRKYYEWLRSVPTVPVLRAQAGDVTGGGAGPGRSRGRGRANAGSAGGSRRGSTGGGSGSGSGSGMEADLGPQSIRWAQRVQVLQGTVDELEKGAMVAQSAMRRDLARLQSRLEQSGEQQDRLSDGLKGAQEELEAMRADVRAATRRAETADVALKEALEAKDAAERAAAAAAAAAAAPTADRVRDGMSPRSLTGEDEGRRKGAVDPARASDVLLAARRAAIDAWTHHVDQRTQRSYWHQKESGETQWQRPSGLDSSFERQIRHEHAASLEAFRGQLSRLFEAVTGELKNQLASILERIAATAGAGGPTPAVLAAAASDETGKYAKETLAALDKEVNRLAATMSLR